MRNEEVVEVLDATSQAVVPQTMRDVIVMDLGPIAGRIETYQETAATIIVATESDAKAAADVCERIAADTKAVKEHQVLSGVIDGFHKMHRRLTALRDAFVTPLESSRKTIKGKIIAWQEVEREKAEAEQRRLQAIADEQARKERERLEKEAAKLKTPEKREARIEQAAQVVAPVISVQAPKVGIRTQKAWIARVVDQNAFFAAVAARPELAGYVEISTTKLARAKQANKMIEIPGVEFKEEIR